MESDPKTPRFHLSILEKVLLLMFLIAATYTAFHGVWWLTLFLTFILIFIGIINWGAAPLRQVTSKWYITLPIYLVSVVSLALFMRIFIFEVYVVPSESMEETIKPGDRILATKLAYGPRIPQSIAEVPWLHIFYLFWCGQEEHALAVAPEEKYRRLKGFNAVERGDIVTFYSPAQPDLLLVKRCIGLPGDTLEIRDGIVYINDTAQMQLPSQKNRFRIWSSDTLVINKAPTGKQLHWWSDPVSEQMLSQALLTPGEAQLWAETKGIDSIQMINKPVDSTGNIWPHKMNIHWSVDNFGPVVIPKAGMRLKSNQYSGSEEKIVTYSEDHYFMIGDNRHRSMDSRFWGFVPENNITAKAVYVLFSTEEPDRFLKKLE